MAPRQMDLNALEARFKEIANGINRAVDLTVRDAVISAVSNVAGRTPVDTGRARSNWRVGLGSPSVGNIRPAFAPYRSRYILPAGPGGDVSEAANTSQVTALAGAIVARRKTDQDVFINNDLPYIGRLNRGHSQQAAPGFVRRGVAAVLPYLVQRAVFHLRREIK